ncbi:MAG: hypothetical protein NUW09_03325, partial [Deltaproteobacteria bacterium]|nr:hypothetical protein [Deltaproteobacteria bacterium]
GQLTDPTWRDAVKEYNGKYRSKSEPVIYPDVNKDEPGAQIKVMGAWIRKAWAKAITLKLKEDEPGLKNYSIMEVAYGLWHEGGAGASAEAKQRVINQVKKYLDDVDKGYKDKTAEIDFYLNDTYVKAHDALDIRDILSPVPKRRSKDSSGATKPARQFHGSRSSSGETLRRDSGDYRIVYRIEPDGSTRGFFICND